jgi:hypothetical protein
MGMLGSCPGASLAYGPHADLYMLWNKIDIWNIVYDINGITDESGEMEMKITSNVILKHISRNDRMSLQQWVKRYTLEQHNIMGLYVR